MIYKNILVPYDGSDHAKNALEVAADFARSNDEACVHVVRVVYLTIEPHMMDLDDPDMEDGVALVDIKRYEKLFDDEEKRAQAHMESVVRTALAHVPAERITCDTMAYPSVADGIEAYAANHGCDLIVMGRRGLGTMRGLLGSVTQAILHKSDLPVMTVK